MIPLISTAGRSCLRYLMLWRKLGHFWEASIAISLPIAIRPQSTKFSFYKYSTR